MKICINDVLCAFSLALDAVEGEMLGATTFHGQRVAYMTHLMAEKLGMTEREQVRLAAAAMLHDNALTEFIQSELIDGNHPDDIHIESNLGKHCVQGENNVKALPFYEHIEGAILYHHERADGSGPFGKRPEEIPLFARMIHIADRVDVRLDFSEPTPEKYEELKERVKKGIGTAYDEEVAELFLSTVTYDELLKIKKGRVTEVLFSVIPRIERDFSSAELTFFAGMFARIIDYKSPFTTRHSKGIAEKARAMGEYYGWDRETCDKLYFAGAVHDIGKLMVDNDLLEKPGKLTPDEYKHIQNHALAGYVILNSIRGLEDVTKWAAYHHERLDGGGYPFGYTAHELGEKERLMACLDIYQALVEPRPYKDGMPHEKAMAILRDIVKEGGLDERITEDINIRFKDEVETLQEA